MGGEVKTGNLVLPGDKLGVIEEYVLGSGTFQEDGVIYSSRIGIVLIDNKAKKISVFPKTTKPLIPKKGDIVLGKVLTVQGKKAVVAIAMVEDKVLSSIFTGQVFIRQVTGDYLDSIDEMFKIGDIIRASVIDDREEVYQLSTANSELGVIKAYCAKCGNTLRRVNKQLKCDSCGSVETRKLASDFGS